MNRATLRWTFTGSDASTQPIRAPRTRSPSCCGRAKERRPSSRLDGAEDEWRAEQPLEFYVDFETVSDLDDDFSRIPEKGGQPLIFMFGCGHVEAGEWRWAAFTVDASTEPSQARSIDDRFARMEAVVQRLANGAPHVFHRSHAEGSSLETAFQLRQEASHGEGLGQPAMVSISLSAWSGTSRSSSGARSDSASRPWPQLCTFMG